MFEFIGVESSLVRLVLVQALLEFPPGWGKPPTPGWSLVVLVLVLVAALNLRLAFLAFSLNLLQFLLGDLRRLLLRPDLLLSQQLVSSC